MARMTISGYGQVELNNVAFRRDGRIEAQCALDAEDFADVPAENGMLLAVDRVNRAVKFPTSANAAVRMFEQVSSQTIEQNVSMVPMCRQYVFL